MRRLANGLRGLGVGRGDRVAWLGPNHPAFLEALFAVGPARGRLAPVNHRLVPRAQSSVLAQTEPVVLVEHGIDGAGRRPPSGVGSRSVTRPAVDADDVGGPRDVPGGSPEMRSMSVGGPRRPVPPPAHVGHDRAPKGVMLTHGNVTWNASTS